MRTATYSSLVLVASGFLFCLISLANGGARDCAGAGCSLYANLEFMGLSFYAWGVMLFALLIFGWGKTWFHHVSILALGADIPFLIWQAFMVPCTSCLTVSVLLTLNACMARAPARAFGPVRGNMARRLVIFAAVALIACGFVNLIKETTTPWSINGTNGSGRNIFFSPSCAPCRLHIQAKAADGTLAQFSLIPIARTADDMAAIHAMAVAFGNDGTAGLLAAISAAVEGVPEPGLTERLRLRFRLHWNYGHLARAGGTSLPWYSGPLDEAPSFTTPVQPLSKPLPDAACGSPASQCSTVNGGLSW